MGHAKKKTAKAKDERTTQGLVRYVTDIIVFSPSDCDLPYKVVSIGDMIAFDLCCDQDHTFEVWFKDGNAFEEQNKKGLVVCPVCGSRNVRKILSPVAVHKASRGGEGSDTQMVLNEFLNKIYQVIKQNTEDVGTDFAKEALKIHYGVTEPKGIRGVATESEEKLLKDEGVSFMKIPVPKRSGEEH